MPASPSLYKPLGLLKGKTILLVTHAIQYLSACDGVLVMAEGKTVEGPASYDTLEHWSQEELAALRGTSVYEELSGLRDASGSLVGPAAVMWDKVVAPIVAAAPEHWPSATLDSFLCACAAGPHNNAKMMPTTTKT